jgi:hypothetical protein
MVKDQNYLSYVFAVLICIMLSFSSFLFANDYYNVTVKCIENSNGTTPTLVGLVWSVEGGVMEGTKVPLTSGPGEWPNGNSTYSNGSDIMEVCGRVEIAINTSSVTINGGDILYLSVTNLANSETNNFSFTLSGSSPQLIEGDYSLPVELSSFTARLLDNTVVLEWQTESESDNLGYNIFRSVDYKDNFEKINGAIISGAGTSTERNFYSFTDARIQNGTTYYYKLQNVDFNGKTEFHGPIAVSVPTSVDVDGTVPTKYELHQNYPNPFNPNTAIQYSLPKTANVKIVIYNELGKAVNTLVSDVKPAGTYTAYWFGRDGSGNQVPSGVYLYRIISDNYSQTKKMLLLK